MNALIAFSNVVARAGHGPSIEVVDAAFMPGKLHFIVGANGSGKSTFLKLALGFLPVLRGHVSWHIGDESWVLDSRHRLPDGFYQHVGYLQQGSESLWPQFDVLEHIERAIMHRCSRLGLAGRAEVRAYAESVLVMLRLDPAKWRRRLDSATVAGTVQGFSGGERQRIAFGRAIAARPQVLMLDELEASLDAETQQQLIGGFMRDFLRNPMHTAFVITHDLAAWSDDWGDCGRQLWKITKKNDKIRVGSER